MIGDIAANASEVSDIIQFQNHEIEDVQQQLMNHFR